MTIRRMSAAAALMISAFAAGCATTRMAVPPALDGAPEWPVRARSWWRPDSPLRVGPFEARDIDRGGVRQRGGIVDVLKGKTEQQQRYGFTLRDTLAGDRWSVRCDNRDVEQGVRLGRVELTLADRSSLECTLLPPGEPELAWTLRMRGDGDGAPTGRLARGGESYEVLGENPHGGQADCCEPLGYLLRREGRLLGVVDRSGRAAVRVAGGVTPDEASLLAAAAVALILQSRLIEDA